MSAPWSEQDEYELVGLARREAHQQARDADYRRRTSLNYLASFVVSGRDMPWPPEQSGVTMAEVEEAAAALRGGEKIVQPNEGKAWAMRTIERQRRLAAPESAPVDTSVDTP